LNLKNFISRDGHYVEISAHGGPRKVLCPQSKMAAWIKTTVAVSVRS